MVVPFGESALTWLLKESLCGNARTTMMACVSPCGAHERETVSTLRYAASAKLLTTSARVSSVPLMARIEALTSEVEFLKGELKANDEANKRMATMTTQQQQLLLSPPPSSSAAASASASSSSSHTAAPHGVSGRHIEGRGGEEEEEGGHNEQQQHLVSVMALLQHELAHVSKEQARLGKRQEAKEILARPARSRRASLMQEQAIKTLQGGGDGDGDSDGGTHHRHHHKGSDDSTGGLSMELLCPGSSSSGSGKNGGGGGNDDDDGWGNNTNDSNADNSGGGDGGGGGGSESDESLYVPLSQNTTGDLAAVRKYWSTADATIAVDNRPTLCALLSNVNADPLLSGKLLLPLSVGGKNLRVGRGMGGSSHQGQGATASPSCHQVQDLELDGYSDIKAEHCVIEYELPPGSKLPTIGSTGEERSVTLADVIEQTVPVPEGFITPLVRSTTTTVTTTTSSTSTNEATLKKKKEQEREDNVEDEDGGGGSGLFQDMQHLEDEAEDGVAEVHVNGERIFGRTRISHGDRIVLGSFSFVGVFVEAPQVLRRRRRALTQAAMAKAASTSKKSQKGKGGSSRGGDGGGSGSESDDDDDDADNAVSPWDRQAIETASKQRLLAADALAEVAYARAMDALTFTDALREMLRSTVKKSHPGHHSAAAATAAGSFVASADTDKIKNQLITSSSNGGGARAEDGQGQGQSGFESSAELVTAHHGARQANCISGELGLGLGFKIVVASSVDVKVSLPHVDVGASLADWTKITLRIEGWCLLPSGDAFGNHGEHEQLWGASHDGGGGGSRSEEENCGVGAQSGGGGEAAAAAAAAAAARAAKLRAATVLKYREYDEDDDGDCSSDDVSSRERAREREREEDVEEMSCLKL
jgi:hypothetical protein